MTGMFRPATSRMIGPIKSSNDVWKEIVATFDAPTLRTLLAQMHLARQDQDRRIAFVQMILALDPDPPCDCDHTYCTDHDADCALLTACTCERRWMGGGQTIAAHAATCVLRQPATWPPPEESP